MDILTALRATAGSKIAFTGAGGKTTSMFALARLLPPPVLITTTTHLAGSQAALADRHFELSADNELPPLSAEILLFTGPASTDGRLGAPPAGFIARLAKAADRTGATLLIEADGAGMRPLKAPADHEPVVPDLCDMVVVTAGLSGLGQPLDAQTVHRHRVFAALSGLSPGGEVTGSSLAAVLAHPRGGLKGIPGGAVRVALLNQADDPHLQARGRGLAARLLPAYQSVLIASMASGLVHAVHGRVAGVVLAAGGSSRLGQPKQLLEWAGQPLVVRAAKAALEAGLHPVVVVTGASAEGVRQALRGLEVETAHNPDWQAGQSGSVRVGQAALPAGTAAVVYLLSDQPFVGSELVRQLVEKHAQTLAPIVAPQIDGQRGNPVLFDRCTFADIDELQGDTGARPLFSRYQAAWVPWHDPRPALDIDKPGDLEKLQGLV